MLVEFFGIPGSGKTYQASLYKARLQKQGAAYFDLSRKKETSIFLKIFYKILDKTLRYWPSYKRMYLSLQDIYKKGGLENPKYLPFSVDYCVNRILQSLFLWKVCGKSAKIFFNDEGLFQWIAFFVVQYAVPLEKIIEALKLSNHNVQVQFVDVFEEKAFLNIKKRDRHVC